MDNGKSTTASSSHPSLLTENSSNRSIALSCVFCDGDKGPLPPSDRSALPSARGLLTLFTACMERKDEVGKLILNHSKTSAKDFPFKFHNTCRAAYVDKKRIALLKRKVDSHVQVLEQDSQPLPKRARRNEAKSFDWKVHCFICCEVEDKWKIGQTFSIVNMNPGSVKQRILDVAEKRSDTSLICRLADERDLFALGARYHRRCFQKYVNEKYIRLAGRVKATTSKHDLAAERTYDHYKEDIEQGKIIPFPDVCATFRRFLENSGIEQEAAIRCCKAVIKKKLLAKCDEISILSQPGNLHSIMCSKRLSICDLYRQLQTCESRCEENKSNLPNIGPTSYSKTMILRQAAVILTEEVNSIEQLNEYPHQDEVSQDASERFVPANLKHFMQMLFDSDALNCPNSDHQSKDSIKRRYLAIAECIIYSIRRETRGRQILTPFHLGILAQLQHEQGSRILVDTLNRYGLCGSYDELRTFLTSVAKDEIQKSSGKTYIPTGIISKPDGGGMIHEGDDNVDISVETLDAKKQYHVMARVIFQDQDHTERNQLRPDRIKVSHEKTLQMPKDTITKLLTFHKPTVRPSPVRQCDVADLLTTQLAHSTLPSCLKDLSWTLLRAHSRDVFQTEKGRTSQIIPSWKGFNSSITKTSEIRTAALYIPSIDAKPADFSTVYTTLKNGQAMALECGQDFHVHTFDQQLYAVAKSIQMSRPEEFGRLVVRLGGFHNMCTFIACVGKIWGDGGLKAMLCDSGLYGPNTTENMLNGKQFHRAVRGLTIVFEALMTLQISSFIQWLQSGSNNQECLDLANTIKMINTVYDIYADNTNRTDGSNEELEQALSQLLQDISSKFFPAFNKFRETMSARSATFRYWNGFLSAIELILLNVRAEREGDWSLHISTQVSMLPYFFSCNRHNYSRWATCYAVDMLTVIPADIRREFCNGNFPVKLTPGKFNGVWSDLAVEMSVIKDTKAKSTGIIGFSLQQSAVLRWTVTRHILGGYAKEMRVRAGLSGGNSSAPHKEERQRLISRDEADVGKVIDHIVTNMRNPFDLGQDDDLLVNISSGLAADEAVCESLLNARDDGTSLMKKFVKERFEPFQDKEITFHATIKKSTLKTFKDMHTRTPITVGRQKKNVALSPELVYHRTLMLAKVRPDVDLETVLSCPMSAIPSSIFNEDGTRRKTNKSDLLHELETTCTSTVGLPPPHTPQSPCALQTVYILDAMAVLQRMNTKNLKFFNDVGRSFMDLILKLFVVASEVHVVFDRYDDAHSTKLEERQSRQKSSGHRYEIAGTRPIPDWKHIMELDSNKGNLTMFLSSYLENCSSEIVDNKKLFLAGGYKDGLSTKLVSNGSVTDQAALETDQKEADTRMILHALNIDVRHQLDNSTIRLVVQSPDTDVLVLLLRYRHSLANTVEVWMETGGTSKHTNHHRYIPVHEIATKIGPSLCESLPAAHALSGCDTVSSFFGVGKKKVWRSLKKLGAEDIAALSRFHEQELDRSVAVARKFVVSLYDASNKYSKYHRDLNVMRYNISKSKPTALSHLPPCEATFIQHVRRAAWQTSTWTSAHLTIPQLPTPQESGWKSNTNGFLAPHYFDGPCALEMLAKFFCACKSKSACATSSCVCNESNIGCTDVCRCKQECYNTYNSTSDGDCDGDF